MMKGLLIILLFTGQTKLVPFSYNPGSKDNDRIVMACSERAEEIRNKISEHSFDDPRGQGWYLKSGNGTFQGYIC